MIKDEVYLYLLMRQDLASMNAGKAVAQGAHAANQMAHLIDFPNIDGERLERWQSWLRSWRDQTGQGFGTTVTLGCTGDEMHRAVEVAQTLCLPAGITHDPTYPLVDGKTLHLIPLDTCGFILGPKVWCRAAVSGLNLMP